MNTFVTDFADVAALQPLWTPDLDALFWRGGRIGVESAWYGHVPFAHWIVGIVKPRLLVELGTHNGVSFSAFCEAVARHRLETSCYAVDTWLGDDQTGYYGEDVYRDLRHFQTYHYGSFSELLRCTFDQALTYFSNDSIDLLHIDGLHTYDAVRHDFESWRPKLSEKGVVLFHDINVRERDFAVWRLWEELQTQFPSFEFSHGHGLGMLVVGQSISPQVAALCSIREPLKAQRIRERFSLLGERWLLAQRGYEQETELRALAVRLESREDERQREREVEQAAVEARIRLLEDQVAERDARVTSLEAEAVRKTATEQQLRARAAQRSQQARTELTNARTRVSTSAFGSRVNEIRLLYISGEPDTPGNIYRVVRHVCAARAAGARAAWIRVDEIPRHLAEIADTDLVIVWRAAWDQRLEQAVDVVRRSGARLIFDIDDLLINPDRARNEIIDGIRTSPWTEQQWKQHCEGFRAAMVAADYCIAPTEELATQIRSFFRPALVLPNGFDRATYQISRHAVRHRRSEKSDELVRIGYAGGSRTHQRDFGVAAEAVARVLRQRPQCRLVLFQFRFGEKTIVPSLIVDEFPVFKGIEAQIEWRDIVPLPKLPEELARFDINIAPLEVGNEFCEAKSELKYFEAALVDVPTVASPTGPYRRAITDGVTGFLASDPDAWSAKLLQLADDQELRRKIALAAQHDVLWKYGSLRRSDAMLSAIPQLRGEPAAASRALSLELHRERAPKPTAIRIPDAETVFEADQLGDAEVTVVVPLFNSVRHLDEVLESVRAQTLEMLDLIVVDDASTDTTLTLAVEWVKLHMGRFNRATVLHNSKSTGLGPTLNAGISAADTPFVLPLNADSTLPPESSHTSLSIIRDAAAAFTYVEIQQPNSDTDRRYPLDPSRFIGEHYFDALGLVSKEAWSAVGGYGDLRSGSEDLDFCHRLIEKGLWGCPITASL